RSLLAVSSGNAPHRIRRRSGSCLPSAGTEAGLPRPDSPRYEHPFSRFVRLPLQRLHRAPIRSRRREVMLRWLPRLRTWAANGIAWWRARASAMFSNYDPEACKTLAQMRAAAHDFEGAQKWCERGLRNHGSDPGLLWMA